MIYALALLVLLGCPEKGWAFGVESGDSIRVVVHGPFTAFGTETWTFAPDSILKAHWDTRRAWNVEQTVKLTFYRLQHEAGYEPIWREAQRYDLKMRDLRCRFASRELPSGHRYVLANLKTLNSPSHPKHHRLEGS